MSQRIRIRFNLLTVFLIVALFASLIALIVQSGRHQAQLSRLEKTKAAQMSALISWYHVEPDVQLFIAWSNSPPRDRERFISGMRTRIFKLIDTGYMFERQLNEVFGERFVVDELQQIIAKLKIPEANDPSSLFDLMSKELVGSGTDPEYTSTLFPYLFDENHIEKSDFLKFLARICE